ncbi:stage VI sporulation protein F [Halobacillus kuroshimensis]|uniref:Stage VI sporulation protein F n=1 Tax=Halobacillus kuroshimensis TaxID=302481 RepID=A0ABS3DTP1_9BACI|nr:MULTISPECIES: stage VI sporulation protein F [Halobacillus]MBN8234689.1 stage VI sporulation protein F [Halobacillus kuroshimensis]
MSDFQKSIFDHLKKKANIDAQDVFKVADKVQHADFSDEKTVRGLVRQLSAVAGKNISKQKEDKIVEAVISQNMPLDMNTLGKFLK